MKAARQAAYPAPLPSTVAGFVVEAGKARLLETRREVERGWWAVSDILVAEGRPELATQVRRFSARMPPPWTDRELIAEALRRRTREARTRDDPAARLPRRRETPSDKSDKVQNGMHRRLHMAGCEW
jgi:hypothetical protein